MENQIADALIDAGYENVERDPSYDTGDMLGFDIDGEKYIVGTSDAAYEAAIEEAKRTWEDCYSDEDKVDWLQKWGWPGVDEEGVLDACADDPADYDEDEEVYRPDTIEEYIDMFGSKASDAFSWDFLQHYVNDSELAEFVVDNDGIANGLARYDGEEISVGDFLAYRVD